MQNPTTERHPPNHRVCSTDARCRHLHTAHFCLPWRCISADMSAAIGTAIVIPPPSSTRLKSPTLCEQRLSRERAQPAWDRAATSRKARWGLFAR